MYVRRSSLRSCYSQPLLSYVPPCAIADVCERRLHTANSRPLYTDPMLFQALLDHVYCIALYIVLYVVAYNMYVHIFEHCNCTCRSVVILYLLYSLSGPFQMSFSIHSSSNCEYKVLRSILHAHGFSEVHNVHLV